MGLALFKFVAILSIARVSIHSVILKKDDACNCYRHHSSLMNTRFDLSLLQIHAEQQPH